MYHPFMSLIAYCMIMIVKQASPPNNPPTDFFSSPVWSFLSGIGGIAAVLAIPIAVVAIVISRRQLRQAEAERTVKELVYEVVSDAPIANINKAVADRVEIRFDGQPVQDLYLLILQITNGGNIAIKPEDYAEPLQIIFSGNKMVSCEVLETSPKNLIADNALKTFLTLDSESVKLSSILLNPGESLSIKVLLTGSKRAMDIRARIADGRLITTDELEKRLIQLRKDKQRQTSQIRAIASIAIVIIYVLILFIGNLTHLFNISSNDPIIIITMALVVGVAVSIVTNATNGIVEDAYTGLKMLIVNWIKNDVP